MPTLQERLEASIVRLGEYMQSQTMAIANAMRFVGSTKADPDKFGYYEFRNSIYFTTSDRETLVELFKLAPAGVLWKKRYEPAAIEYRCNPVEGDDYAIIIVANEGALPETCKIVEEEVEVPAQPATTKKVRKLSCSHAEPTDSAAPADAASSAVPVDAVVNTDEETKI